MDIKPGINAEGFRTAVKDYTEPTVIEELCANSYDADATTVLVLLDLLQNRLLIIDNGVGFDDDSIQNVVTLGGGSKKENAFSRGKRHYLGSYGYGLKSTLNIATKVILRSYSNGKKYNVEIDWAKLDDMLNNTSKSYRNTISDTITKANGTIIEILLKNPTTKGHLEKFGSVLSNLPSDSGNFKCYYGMYDDFSDDIKDEEKYLSKLSKIAERAFNDNKVRLSADSNMSELEQCKQINYVDKEDKTATGLIYYAGLENDKARHLKPGLRGIYVRIHGRLLKQSFTDRKYTYNISNWIKFESGLRIELNIDWLRDQITLSREGIRFSNEKLERDFADILHRCATSVMQPELKKIKKKQIEKIESSEKQRMELAKKRKKEEADVLLGNTKFGFQYRPETDAELALVISQPGILKSIYPNVKLLDYNAQASYDCLMLDLETDTFIKVELEPKLSSFLDHENVQDIDTVIAWSKTGWRIGQGKQYKKGYLTLISDDENGKGYYKLSDRPKPDSKSIRKFIKVIIVEDILLKE